MSQAHHAPPTAVESFDRTGILVLVVLCLAMFTSGMNAMGLQPFLVSVGEDLGVSVPSVGQAVTVTLLMSAVSGLIAGPIADHYGHRRLMVLGAAVLAVSAIGSALSPTYFIFMGFRLFGGLSLALLTGLALAIAGSYFAGEARRRALSVTVSAMSGTAILGVPLLSWIGDAFSWRWAFGTIGAIAIVLIPILATLIPSTLAPTRRFRLSQLISSYRPLLAQRAMIALYIGSFLRAIFWLGILTYFGAFLIEEHGLTLQQVGITYMFGGLGFLIGSLAAGGRVGQFNHRTLFTIVTVVGALFFGLAYTAPVGPIGAVLLLTIGGFFGAMGWVVLNTMMANESDAGAGTTMSLNTAIFNLGSAAGGAAGGAILAVGGYSAIGLTLPVLALIASVVVMLSGRFRPMATTTKS
ncbi:MAG: MFS transporter [Sphaerobacteraceae bacterium]|nr:MAG: MFS transporter [Sphaerobacteraceae bacterium]